MRLLRFMIPVVFVTMLALVYVHQQIESVKLSYSIELREKKLKDILDRNEALGYNIANLEAPLRLEQVLLSKKVDITFPKKSQVIRITKLASADRRSRILRSAGTERHFGIFGIFEFLNPRSEAHARE